jgi:hypothetical protein
MLGGCFDTQARENLLSLTGGEPSVVLLQITGVGSVSREPISVYSEAATVRAFAILGALPANSSHSSSGVQQSCLAVGPARGRKGSYAPMRAAPSLPSPTTDAHSARLPERARKHCDCSRSWLQNMGKHGVVLNFGKEKPPEPGRSPEF